MVGSIILLISGIFAALGIFVLIFYPAYAISSFFWGISMIILGLLGIGASPFAFRLPSGIWLIILAIIAAIFGVWWIAWLIAIGAILALISRG